MAASQFESWGWALLHSLAKSGWEKPELVTEDRGLHHCFYQRQKAGDVAMETIERLYSRALPQALASYQCCPGLVHATVVIPNPAMQTATATGTRLPVFKVLRVILAK